MVINVLIYSKQWLVCFRFNIKEVDNNYNVPTIFDRLAETGGERRKTR
jgi:hypothetical protein